MDSPTGKIHHIRSPSPDPDSPDTRPATFLEAASAFPHLVDLVIKFTPLDTLPTLRLTCHYIRNRVDDLFPRHIAFEKDGTISTKNHKGMWINGAPFDPSFVKIVDYRNTPVEVTPYGSPCCCHSNSDLRHRIDHIISLAPQLTSVRMTRQLYHVCSYIPYLPQRYVPRCIYFIDQDSPSSVTSRPPPISDAGLAPAPRCEELVINIRYPSALPFISNLVPAELCADLTSILFTPWPKGSSGKHPQGTATHSKARNGWSYTVMHLADIVQPQLEECCDHVQIAGFEVWGSKVFGAPRNRRSACDKCHWEQEFFDDFTFTLLESGYDHPDITKLKRRVSFIALDEYRTQVGDEQLKLAMDAWE